MPSSKSLIELVTELQPQNGSEFCLRYLNNSLNSTTGAVVAIQTSPPAWQVWGIGLAMVTVISLSAALGILLLPFLPPAFYKRTLIYFTALGVGTLSGSAIFNLIPEAFDLHAVVPDYLAKAWMIIAGIYLFYLVDKILNIACEIKERAAMIKPDTQLTAKSNGSAFSDTATQQSAKGSVVSTGRRQSIESKSSHIASVAWLVVFGDGLHNFIDGLSIGAAFNESLLDGISISVAVLCEEVPHELGDCAILINSGMSNRKALVYNLLSASTCFAGFIIGVLVGEMNRNFGQFIFALAGGMFLYISLAGMLSDMNKKAEDELKESMKSGAHMMMLQTAGLATGIVIMYIFAQYGSLIQF